MGGQQIYRQLRSLWWKVCLGRSHSIGMLAAWNLAFISQQDFQPEAEELTPVSGALVCAVILAILVVSLRLAGPRQSRPFLNLSPAS